MLDSSEDSDDLAKLNPRTGCLLLSLLEIDNVRCS